MTDIDWSDHRFALVPGKAAPKEITAVDLDQRPYTETHTKAGRRETGVVFFPDLATARKYKEVMNVQAVVVAFPDPDRAVRVSLEKWRCNVVYFVTLEGKLFQRHVTEFRSETEDGQHRGKFD
jgi:hypothetical protein